MSSIGNFNFMTMSRAKIAEPTVVVQIFDRPGSDGIVYRKGAAKPKETVLNTKEGVSSISIGNGRQEDYAALKGTKVTIINDMGRTSQNVLIVDVDVELVREIINGSDADIEAMVYATWQVIIPEKTA